jgi:hypothetical protein
MPDSVTVGLKARSSGRHSVRVSKRRGRSTRDAQAGDRGDAEELLGAALLALGDVAGVAVVEVSFEALVGGLADDEENELADG